MDATSSRKIGKPMASRWRQRRMCLIVADQPAPAAIRQISARGAFIETNDRPPLGATVELRHPDAGIIRGKVSAVALDGIELVFTCGAGSVAFALAAIGADMSRPAR
jgi:hypothetical protein